jgi:hypothetical protein
MVNGVRRKDVIDADKASVESMLCYRAQTLSGTASATKIERMPP